MGQGSDPSHRLSLAERLELHVLAENESRRGARPTMPTIPACKRPRSSFGSVEFWHTTGTGAVSTRIREGQQERDRQRLASRHLTLRQKRRIRAAQERVDASPSP